MPTVSVTQLGGVNTYLNPVNGEGQLIHSVNFDSYPYGAKTKRPGYVTYLGTADGSAVNSLFTWYKNDGTTFFNYRASGTKLYYSTQGTGAWTVCGNGTISAGAKVGHAVLDDTMIVGDGAGSTRHTTDGTSFTNTTLAPISNSFAQYQGRIYAAGTSSTEFYSTTNNAADWATSGTSDSSSFTVPGAGKMGATYVISDRLVLTKNSGLMHRWDGYSLVDMATDLGPTSPYSVANVEGYGFHINRLGIMGYGGAKPTLISNAIQRQFYNNAGSGIVGTVFDTAPGVVHRYDYLVSVGAVTDDFVGKTMNNCIIKYDYQKNELLNYDFANKPTALNSYKDASGNQQLIFGDSSGQCYTYGGTATSDNGSPIPCSMEYVLHIGDPTEDKNFRWFNGIFNPGCEASVQVAIGNTYTEQRKKWVDIGQAVDGLVEYRFPQGSRGKILFIRVHESSKDYPLTCYGFTVDAEIIKTP